MKLRYYIRLKDQNELLNVLFPAVKCFMSQSDMCWIMPKEANADSIEERQDGLLLLALLQ
jgi:hypothetical protein